MLDAGEYLTDLHRLRVAANLNGMFGVQDALRLAIVEAAIEFDQPTGLDAQDLLKGPCFQALLFIAKDGNPPMRVRETLEDFLCRNAHQPKARSGSH